MGSFVYMIARDDADIIEEKRPEFEERLEKVFNAAGMMEQEHLTLFGKGIRALRPVRIENGYTTFFYNYFEDDVWENAGYYNKNGGVYSEKVGWRNFARAIEAAYMLQMLYMQEPSFVVYNNELVPPWQYLQWFKNLFGTTYQLPEKDLMKLIEMLHEEERSYPEIYYSYNELICSGYYLESVIDAIAVVYGTARALELLKNALDKENSKKAGVNYPECIKNTVRSLEKFKGNSSLDDDGQVDYLMKKMRTMVETGTVGDQEDQGIMEILFWVRVSGSYAFAIKRISELYNRDFWELYAPVAGMNKKRSFSENLWSETQSLLISGISTAEFVNESPDDMLYYWTPEGDIEISDDVEKWFSELKKQFDEYVAEWQQIPKLMRYIVDDLLFADRNYVNIRAFSGFLEETMDNISDVRYHILWRIFHDMIHDPDMLKEGSVIFDKESLANGKKKLRYSWTMTATDSKRNKARMTIRRYLSLIANKELRRKVFGF